MAIAVLARVAVLAWRDYQLWASTVNDPSARDLYLTSLEIDGVIAAFVLIVLVCGQLVLGLAQRLSARDVHSLPADAS